MNDARLHETLFRICTIELCPQRFALSIPAFGKRNQWNTHTFYIIAIVVRLRDQFRRDGREIIYG